MFFSVLTEYTESWLMQPHHFYHPSLILYFKIELFVSIYTFSCTELQVMYITQLNRVGEVCFSTHEPGWTAHKPQAVSETDTTEQTAASFL